MSRQLMLDRTVNLMVRLRRRTFYQVTQKTLVMLFPFVLIGCFCQVLAFSVFAKNGFSATILHTNQVIPGHQSLYYIFNGLGQLTIGVISVMAAFEAAKYTAKHYQKDDQIAGITGALAFLIVSYQFNHAGDMVFYVSHLGYQGLFAGIITGYLSGQIFHWLGRGVSDSRDTTMSALLERTIDSLLPITVCLILAMTVSVIVTILINAGVVATVLLWLQNTAAHQHQFLVTIGVGALTAFMGIFGLAGPYNRGLTASGDSRILDNLNYALAHGNAWHVPYPFIENTLYSTYGLFGGTGGTLALILAIFMGSRNRNYGTVSRWSLFPAIFNNNGPILLGIPVLFNPIYVVPFVLVPVMNMMIATLVIWLHWVPAVTYPIPVGTPGPLVAFVGTNANVAALIFGILLLILDAFVYLPFVRLAERVLIRDHEVEQMSGEATHHETT